MHGITGKALRNQFSPLLVSAIISKMRFIPELTRKQYEQFLETTEQADMFQDSLWSEVSVAKGWKNTFFCGLGESADQLTIAAMGYVISSKGFGEYIYIQHGPVFKANQAYVEANSWGTQPDTIHELDTSELIAQFIAGLNKLAKDIGVFAIVMEPLADINSHLGIYMQKQDWRRMPRAILPTYPMYMDLRKTEDELMADMDKKTRYNVRYAGRKGVEVEFHYPDKDKHTEQIEVVRQFYEMLIQMTTRKGYADKLPSLAFFEKAWEKYQGTKEIGIALAKHENGIASANFTMFYKHWAGSYYTANLVTKEFRRLRASYLLKWETILEAKRQGKTIFDMWGYVPNLPKDHSEYGYGQFKFGFNPVKREFCGRMIKPLNPAKFYLWAGLGELRRIFA